jgi:DNA-binding transcriptional regulator YiaG
MTPIENIRRNVLKLTQADMAALAGVSQATVSRWESGRLVVDGDAMTRIRLKAREQSDWSDALFFSLPQSIRDAGATA